MKKGIYYNPFNLEMIEILSKSIFADYRVMYFYVVNECGTYEAVRSFYKEELKNFKYLDEV